MCTIVHNEITMNITTEQLRHLNSLLSKEDKEEIASLTGLAYLSIRAVLRGERTNDLAEFLIYQKAREKCNKLNLTIEQIERQNKK